MIKLKNIFFGFTVSFLGSIPLGYLNIIGVGIFSKSGITALIPYLLGIVIVEAFVIYITVNFAKRLAENKKLMKVIYFFTLFFFLLLAYLFFTNSNQTTSDQNYLDKYRDFSPLFLGMILCSFNFIQIPFWLGWNLYLLNANFISLDQKLKFYYIFGILFGTFFGMLGIIYLLNSISKKILDSSKLIVPILLPLLFLVLAFFQGYKIHKKYFKIQTQ